MNNKSKFFLVIVLIMMICINNVFAETLLNTKIEIINHKLSGINILNVDTLDNKMQGTKFKIINKDTAGLVGEYTTDINGNISIGNLVQGNYQVIQTQTLVGYELNTNAFDLKVEFDKSNTELKVVNQFLGNIKIITKDSKTKELLKNAKFKVTNINNNDSKDYTTNENGEIYIEKTQTSNYTIEQFEAPEYYQKDDTKYTISIVPEVTITQDIENKPYSDLNIYSLDNYNDNPLKDTKFRVTNLDNNQLIGEFNTDVNGLIKLEHLYPANYKIEQIDLDKRYDPFSEVKTVKIDLAQDPTDVRFYSKKLGGINIIKKNVNQEIMKGVKFRILRSNDELLGEYETDLNGEILVEYLPAGEYKVLEIATLEGYYIDPTIYNITVKDQEKEELNNDVKSSLLQEILQLFNF